MKILKIIYNRYIYRKYINSKLCEQSNNFRLGYDSEIHHPEFISIGNNFYSGPKTYMGTNEYNPIIIGNDVMFGAECMIIGGNHNIKYNENHMIFNQKKEPKGERIIIGDGVWVATRCMIISGGNIGEGAVVGAMSLVNKIIPPYTVAAGIPVKVIKPRFDKWEDLKQLLKNVKSELTIEKINTIYTQYNLPIYETEERK